MFASSANANANLKKLSLNIPECKAPPGKPLPIKYYTVAKKFKEFQWVYKVKRSDLSASGEGDERVDGSKMYDWYSFIKLDINNDGWCDWFTTSLAPVSTGGDSITLNTLYFGGPTGWKRFGATIPKDKPDGLGWGKSSSEQQNYSYSSEPPLIIRDASTNRNYLIGSYNYRSVSGHPGYHIYSWNKKKHTLTHLNKWLPGSVGYQVYAYFKQHGAVDPTEEKSSIDRIVKFNPEIEKRELSLKCGAINEKTNHSYLIKSCKAYINDNKTK